MRHWLAGIGEDADDLAAVVDVGGGCPGTVRPVDGSEPPLVPQVPVDHAAGVDVLAHHLTAIVDAEGLRLHGIGDMDRGEPAPVQQEATLVIRARGRIGVAVDAHDLAGVVDVERRSRLRRESRSW